MMDIRFRPISQWPGEMCAERRRSIFKAKFSQTLDLLNRELSYLDVASLVIEAGFTESEIRLDGWPKSIARPAHPGVILSFESKFGALRYPCDTFTDWHDNLRAIGLALEALRKVDRYGVTKRAEQYTGWRQLPSPNGSNGVFRTRADAAHFIASFCDADPLDIETDREVARTAYKVAAKRVHPDAPNGSDAAFKGLQSARVMLGIK